MEAEADSFAVGKVGAYALLDYLRHVLKTGPTGGDNGWNNLGRKALELRMAKGKLLDSSQPG